MAMAHEAQGVSAQDGLVGTLESMPELKLGPTHPARHARAEARAYVLEPTY